MLSQWIYVVEKYNLRLLRKETEEGRVRRETETLHKIEDWRELLKEEEEWALWVHEKQADFETMWGE